MTPQPARPSVDLTVFGATVLRVGEGPRIPLTPAERRLLAAVAMAGERGVTPDRLIELIWSGGAPTTARQSLQNHVSRLRRKAPALGIGWDGTHYRFAPPPAIDTEIFDQLVGDALAATAQQRSDVALPLLQAATALAVATAYGDLDTDPEVAAHRARLDARRAEAEELAAAALMALDRTGEAIGELERLVRIEPDRERRWELLLQALQAVGRRADALEAYQRARRSLIERHGVEPGPRLRVLQAGLLAARPSARIAPTVGGSQAAIGREALCSAIMRDLDAGRVVALSGPAGIGKTTVLTALRHRWPGAVVLVDCGSNPWTALGPVQDLLDRLAIRLQDLPRPSTVEGLASGRGRRRVTVRRAGTLVARSVEAIAAALRATSGTLLVLDDIDRAGPTTRAILAGTVAAAGVPTILASRADDFRLDGVEHMVRLALEGLDAAGLQALTQAVLGSERTPEDLGGWLHQLTGGHPLFALELLTTIGPRLLADPVPSIAALQGEALPAAFNDALAARLDRLANEVQRAVDVAAVMGDVLDVDVLRRLTDLAKLEEALEEGILRRVGSHGLRFSHPLVRRVAYARVPSGRRREVHHAIGLYSTSADQRAWHMEAASDLDPDGAVAALAAAADEALASQAYADAADRFGRAVAIAGQHAMDEVDVLSLRLEQADATRLAGIPGHAETLLEIAEAVMDTDHVDLRRRASLASVQLGEAVDPGPLQQRAVALTRRALHGETDPSWRARISGTSSLLHSMAGESEQCRALFVEALTLMPDLDEVVVDVLPYAYMALGHPDDLPQRELLAARLHLAGLHTGDAAALWEAGHLRFSCALMRGDGPMARAAHAAMAELIPQTGDAGHRWSMGYQEAALAATAGDFERAESLTMETLQIGTGVAPSRALSVASAQLFEIRRRQGRLGELRDSLEYLIAEQPEISAWRAAGALVHAPDDPRRAEVLFDGLARDDFAALPRDFTWLAGMMLLGAAAVILGDGDRGGAVLPHLRPYADLVCWQGSCAFGPVAEVVAGLAALLGQAEDAATHAVTAQRLTSSLAL